jgi:energy-coupling factor transport system ATP-binding protein
MNVLTVQNVSFSYTGSDYKAVDSVSFSISSGEYVAVLGKNGSGKSTLARLLSGFLSADEGKVLISEKCNTLACPTGIVFQSPKEQIVGAITERDTAFGPENIKLTKDEIQQVVTECLKTTGLLDKREEKTASLSLGQKQKLALAGILALSPSILILDEAVSMVDPEMRKAILDFLDDWWKQGHTIIHITHDCDEAARANRILVMDEGKLIFDGVQKSFVENIILQENIFGKQPERSFSKSLNNDIALSIKDMSFSYDRQKSLFSDFSVAFEKGSLTAIMGVSGSGKSTFFEIVAGLLAFNSGTVSCNTKPVLALQETENALFEEFVADDVAFGPSNQGISGNELKERVRWSMEMCGLPFNTFADRQTFALSGGERRKVSLATIIALSSEVYLFDEPTAGLDPVSRKRILKTLEQLTASGKTVIYSTHRMEEGSFADRCITLENGVIVSDTSPVPLPSQNSLPDIEKLNTSLLQGLSATASGLYQKKSSFIHNMAPVSKLLVFLVLFITGLILRSIPALLIGTFFCWGYALLSKYSIKKLIYTFILFLPWLALFAFLQFLLMVPRLEVTPEKITLIITTILHVLAAYPVVVGFLYSTDESEILDGLKILFRNRHLSLLFSLVFRFVPLLSDIAAQIIKVQIIRGGLKPKKGFFNKIKIMLPLFIPLILQTLRRAESFGETLDARYF